MITDVCCDEIWSVVHQVSILWGHYCDGYLHFQCAAAPGPGSSLRPASHGFESVEAVEVERWYH